MLESEEAARRLGIKTTTLYAYVSRGLLASHPSPHRRRRLFDVEDIERLAARSRTGKTVESRLATVTTSITQLRDDGPAYRGVPAVELALTTSFEEVAEQLWNVEPDDGPDPTWEPLALGNPPELGASDMMRWVVVMVGARNPLRADLRPASVIRTARAAAASMVDLLPPAS
ncbi:MAG TPA: citrate synthase, partial [Acidimicrobiales bacterium]|nr:citrate synthase [Acidimicrobiales bacterium]